jgi:hypothetical protein
LDAPPVLSVASPKQQLTAADSLMAHELSGTSRPGASQQSVWLAAAAALAVAGIAAFFLLTPTTVPAPSSQSSQSAVKQAPEQLAVPAPAPGLAPAPTLQFVPAHPEPAEPAAPRPDSPQPAAHNGTGEVAPSPLTAAVPALPSTAPKRKSAARNEPTRRQEPPRSQLGRPPATAPSAKPEPRAKSADDMLGF